MTLPEIDFSHYRPLQIKIIRIFRSNLRSPCKIGSSSHYIHKVIRENEKEKRILARERALKKHFTRTFLTIPCYLAFM
ncbi:hypothetical protein TNCT_58341, partial [Trichonephila clavata]